MSVSTENFIKVIFINSQIQGLDTKPGSIARMLGISNAAATDMSRKLARKKLVNYTRYHQLTLTQKGREMALGVIRKHRLWEAFLYKTLNLSLHEIHREAEMLEHQTSDFLAEKLSAYLGHPGHDPHGDPIPMPGGEMEYAQDSKTLADAAPGAEYQVSRLFSSNEDFFAFCADNNIKPGQQLRVLKQYVTQDSTEIEINGQKILLNKSFTSIIYVKPLKTQEHVQMGDNLNFII